MRRSHYHSAFTLVELLVSIAIALLLVVGVNTVFKVTAQTVGAGNSLLTANRDARTVFQTFLADMNNVDAVPGAGSSSGDGPFFVIRSDHMYAFRNAADQQAATNQSNPSMDSNLFANFGGQCPLPLMHYRSHRVDRLGFFARETFARQTSSDNRFVSSTVGNEAFVYFGHSQQPSNVAAVGGGTWFDPGAGTAITNKSNYFASDWMLSRMAIILVKQPISPGTPTDSNYLGDPSRSGLAPLVGVAGVNDGVSTSLSTVTPVYQLPTARYDLGDSSIATYNASPSVRPNGIQSYSYLLDSNGNHYLNYRKDWWDPVISYRYQASPFIMSTTTTPKITPNTLSQCAPDLIRGCSQFIVEYAGNFYTKDVNGNAAATLNDGSGTAQTVPTPDATGQVDFLMVNGARQVRWYGFPRSTAGSATVSATSGDVVPLRDVLASVNSAWTNDTNGVPYADAEHFNNLPQSANYFTGMSSSASYTAAWGPDVKNMRFPKMVRIIIEVDDREGRLYQPQRYEFIYDVQQ